MQQRQDERLLPLVAFFVVDGAQTVQMQQEDDLWSCVVPGFLKLLKNAAGDGANVGPLKNSARTLIRSINKVTQKRHHVNQLRTANINRCIV